jgi:hypothetical protein
MTCTHRQGRHVEYHMPREQSLPQKALFSTPRLCHPLAHPCAEPAVRTGYLTPSRSFVPAFSRFCPSCSVLSIFCYNHASPTDARSSSSSNSLQCDPYRFLDSPTPRYCQPVARCRPHTALLARRDAPVDTPHRQVIAQQAQTGHRRGCAKGRRQQE